MTQNTAIVLIFLFIPSAVSLFHLWSAAYSLYIQGKSKTRIKKIGKTTNLWYKFLLLYPIEPDSLHYRTINIIRRLYYLVTLVFLICVLLLAVSTVSSFMLDILPYGVAIKVLAVDIPIGIFSFVMTKHGKNGGVVWKWEK